LLYTRSELYVRREEYFKALGSGSVVEALKSVPKEFTAKILESLGGGVVSLNSVLALLESFHVELLNELSSQLYVRDFALHVNGILSAYSTTIALLGYEKGLKPVSYLPGISPGVIEDYASGRRPSAPLNAYSERLLSAFVDHKGIRVEDVLGVFDGIKRELDGVLNYGERLVVGLVHDLVALRLCTVSGKFRDAPWRPMLIDQRDLLAICRMATADLYSAVEALRKTGPLITALKKARPVMSIASSIAVDALRVIGGDEVFDFLVAVAPAYLSPLVLRAEARSLFLKDFFATLRQLALLRLALTLVHSGDEELKSEFKSFIERWVRP